MSSKNNVNPDHYKIGGRGRPGDPVVVASPLTRAAHERTEVPGQRRLPGDVIRMRPIQLVRPTKRRASRAKRKTQAANRARQSRSARTTRKRSAATTGVRRTNRARGGSKTRPMARKSLRHA